MKEINENEFESIVLNSKDKVLVDFYANWCGPCKMLRPILESVANKTKANIVSVNVDDSENLARKYGIMSIPCLILFKDGKEISRSVGLKTEDEIESMIK